MDKSIKSADELLVVLRQNPSRRAITYVSARDGEEYAAAIEYPTDDPRGGGIFLAWVANGSEARQLLDAAYDAVCRRDLAAWTVLPLRYGPYCSTWILPDHPRAPRTCEGDDE